MVSLSVIDLFVCVEVLPPSQPNRVMSSAVSLPNHNFIGQAESFKRLTSIVHILSPETDNCPSWISGRERMTVENSPRKNVADPAGVEPATSWSPVGRASKWATVAGLSVTELFIENVYWITDLRRVDSSARFLWTCLIQVPQCLVRFYYYYIL